MSNLGVDTRGLRDVFKTMWWVLLLRGILMLLFGIFMVAWPEPVLLAFVWLFGIYAVLDGVASLVHVARTRSHIGMGVGLGIVSILAGLAALIWPGITAVVVLFIVAAWVLLLGIIQLAAGVSLKSVPGSGWGWAVASGVFSMILGFILFAAPGEGILAILVFVGAMTAASGLALIIFSFVARKFARTGV